MRHASLILVALMVAGCAGTAQSGGQTPVSLTVVNIETPQGVKIWEPTSVVAKKGDTVALKLINRHADEHGYEIAAFGVKEVVQANQSKDVSFKADKAGVFPIKCHLHPAHVVGQLLVLD